MMEESAEAATRREEMLRMYRACKDALQIIGKLIDICMKLSIIIIFDVHYQVTSQWQPYHRHCHRR